MNKRLRLILSIFLAVIAVCLSYVYLTKSKDEVQIVIAAKDLEQGVEIEDSQLEMRTIPREVKDEFFKNSFEKKDEIVGCVTKQKIEGGQPILADEKVLAMGEELLSVLSKEGIVNEAYFIPEDSRLITIEVDNSGSLYYSIKKGDFVDVIFSSVDESTGGLYSSMLLQHIEVFNVEKIITEENGVIAKKQNITMVTTAEECLILAAGNRNGILDLALNPLKGYTESIAPVSILNFKPDTPMTKEQQLNNLKEYIKIFNMSENTKKKVLLSLDEERSIDALVEFISATILDEVTKDELLKILNKEGN